MSTDIQRNYDPIPEPTLTQESALALHTGLEDLKGAVDYQLDPVMYPEIYDTVHGIHAEIVGLVTELDPDFAWEHPTFSNTERSVREARLMAVSGGDYTDQNRFRVIVNRLAGFSPRGVPIINLGDIRHYGLGEFSISISPSLAAASQDVLLEGIDEQVTTEVGPEVGDVIVFAHELAHAVHKENRDELVDQYLRQNPAWALSDDLEHATKIEIERFAVGVELIVTARYLAKMYGGDEAKIEEKLRHNSFKIRGSECVLQSSEVNDPYNQIEERRETEEKDNPGYSFPLTREQLKERLKLLTANNRARLKDEGLSELEVWNGMDRTATGEWMRATKDTQLSLGLRGLVEHMKVRKAEKGRVGKFVDKHEKKIFVGELMLAAGLAGLTIGNSMADSKPNHNQTPVPAQQEVIDMVNGEMIEINGQTYMMHDGQLTAVQTEDQGKKKISDRLAEKIRRAQEK